MKITIHENKSNHSNKPIVSERYVTSVSSTWVFDRELAADIIQEIGWGRPSDDNTYNLHRADDWEEYFKNKDDTGFAKAIDKFVEACQWDGTGESTGSLSSLEFARLLIYMYYNKC